MDEKKSGPHRVGDLEIAEDMDFERRDWTVERVGWVVMLLLAVAALLGLLGPGPLTRMTVGERGGPLTVEYYRFERVENPSTLKVNLVPPAEEDELKLWVDRTYAEAITFEQITPEPAEMELSADRLVLTFELGETGKETAIMLHLRHQEFGSMQGRIGIVDGPEVSFKQFVYP